MRAITVRQPWASAIIHLGKDVENRTIPWMWRHLVGERIAIHAGARIDPDGLIDPVLNRAWSARHPHQPIDPILTTSAIIGTVHVTDLHWADECGGCSPWAQGPWIGEKRICHLTLTDPRPLATPMLARGKLGAWHLPADLDRLVRSDLAALGVSA